MNARTIVAAAIAAAFAVTAHAAEKAPPAWKQGMPENYKDSKLAPHPGKMTETLPSEVPVEKLKVPSGFKVELWATGLPGGRAMAMTDDGKKIYVGTRALRAARAAARSLSRISDRWE